MNQGLPILMLLQLKQSDHAEHRLDPDKKVFVTFQLSHSGLE
jgi:hypothetical protein